MGLMESTEMTAHPVSMVHPAGIMRILPAPAHGIEYLHIVPFRARQKVKKNLLAIAQGIGIRVMFIVLLRDPIVILALLLLGLAQGHCEELLWIR